MSKYRKKPVIIDAFQFFNVKDKGCIKITDGKLETVYPIYKDKNSYFLLIKTLEGTHRASEGDWIIIGVKGEHYPCKPDIFALTYEPI